MQFEGYHGTTIKNANNILKYGYKVSGKDSWLGSGVYFFETYFICDGYEEAKSWIKIVKKKSHNWAVLKSMLETDKYIDLVENKSHRRIFDKVKAALLEKHQELEKDPLEFSDRIIFANLAKSNIELIRALVDGSRYQGYYSYTVGRPQIQICVKKKNVIRKNMLLSSAQS